MCHSSKRVCQIIKENRSLIIIVIYINIICYYVGFYNYIPETNNVSKTYNVADILWFQFVAHVMLFLMTSFLSFSINTSASKVFSAHCCCFLYFTAFLLALFVTQLFRNFFVVVSNCSCYYRYNLTFVFTFHVGLISILRSLYFKTFSYSFLIIFISPEIAICINQTCFFFPLS